MDRVRQRVGDKRVLTLVKAFLKAGNLTEDGTLADTTAGSPQGSMLSISCVRCCKAGRRRIQLQPYCVDLFQHLIGNWGNDRVLDFRWSPCPKWPAEAGQPRLRVPGPGERVGQSADGVHQLAGDPLPHLGAWSSHGFLTLAVVNALGRLMERCSRKSSP